MSDDDERSPASSPVAAGSPAYSRSSTPTSPHSEAPLNAPESPSGDAEDIYKTDAGSAGSAGSPSPVRKNKVAFDSDDSDDEEEPGKRALIDSDEEGTSSRPPTTKQLFGDDSDDDDDGPKKADDDLDEFVKGAPDEEEDKHEKRARSDSDDDEGPRDRHGRTFEWDFDKMLAEKKAERKRKVRRGGKDGGIDIINDDDGLVSRLTERMKAAAKSDRNANVERKPAFQKIKMLPEVKAMLLKAGIVDALIENGFMSALSEWLAPLPDKCLPALDIRITVLKLLHTPRFWKLDRSTLKQSGLGKAIMMLYKHPNETKENKAIANKLIGEWARPIYHLDADYSTVSRQDREERDYARMPAKRRAKLGSRDEEEEQSREKRPKIRDSERLGPTKSGELKPGDKGYVNRARVPKPSTKDYVVRPEWKVAGEFKGEKKASGSNRYEQTFRDFQERTKKSSANRLMKVSLEGRNMGI